MAILFMSVTVLGKRACCVCSIRVVHYLPLFGDCVTYEVLMRVANVSPSHSIEKSTLLLSTSAPRLSSSLSVFSSLHHWALIVRSFICMNASLLGVFAFFCSIVIKKKKRTMCAPRERTLKSVSPWVWADSEQIRQTEVHWPMARWPTSSQC